ncbi:hypothetical protein [Streptomyces coelicoflavus]|uniref:hypothetical protein n=1 Tax=Streptomyces coelicoflavus TaxID=285562 RepID=UPI003318F2A0
MVAQRVSTAVPSFIGGALEREGDAAVAVGLASWAGRESLVPLPSALVADEPSFSPEVLQLLAASPFRSHPALSWPREHPLNTGTITMAATTALWAHPRMYMAQG